MFSVESNRKIIGSHRATVAVAIFGGKRIAKGPRGRLFGGLLGLTVAIVAHDMVHCRYVHHA